MPEMKSYAVCSRVGELSDIVKVRQPVESNSLNYVIRFFRKYREMLHGTDMSLYSNPKGFLLLRGLDVSKNRYALQEIDVENITNL